MLIFPQLFVKRDSKSRNLKVAGLCWSRSGHVFPGMFGIFGWLEKRLGLYLLNRLDFTARIS